MLRLSSTGATTWSRTFGDRDHDEGRAIALSPAGDRLVVAGLFRFTLELDGKPIESKRPTGVTIPMADVFVTSLQP